jgi:hypothetical protein
MVRPEGFEPPAYWFEASRSIQVSYGRRTMIAANPVRTESHNAGTDQLVCRGTRFVPTIVCPLSSVIATLIVTASGGSGVPAGYG